MEVRPVPAIETDESPGVKSDYFALSPVFCDDLVCPCAFPCASLCHGALTVHGHRAHHGSLQRTRVQAGQANLGQEAEGELEGMWAGERAWGWCAER